MLARLWRFCRRQIGGYTRNTRDFELLWNANESKGWTVFFMCIFCAHLTRACVGGYLCVCANRTLRRNSDQSQQSNIYRFIFTPTETGKLPVTTCSYHDKKWKSYLWGSVDKYSTNGPHSLRGKDTDAAAMVGRVQVRALLKSDGHSRLPKPRTANMMISTCTRTGIWVLHWGFDFAGKGN